MDIDRFVESEIRKLAPYADLTFKRVAVTPEQIEAYSLPTRPTKKTDSRSKNFTGESVVVDAIDPPTLKQICEACIVQHVDRLALQRMKVAEEAERETLQGFIDQMGAA